MKCGNESNCSKRMLTRVFYVDCNKNIYEICIWLEWWILTEMLCHHVIYYLVKPNLDIFFTLDTFPFVSNFHHFSTSHQYLTESIRIILLTKNTRMAKINPTVAIFVQSKALKFVVHVQDRIYLFFNGIKYKWLVVNCIRKWQIIREIQLWIYWLVWSS